MVSTRHMSIGNSANVNEITPTNSHINNSNTNALSRQITENYGPARFTRNSANLLANYGRGGGASTSSSSTSLPSHEVQSYRAQNPPVQITKLLDLPPEIVEKIFSYLSFKEICKVRLVCRRIDQICGYILNSTFLKLQNQMLQRFQDIKSKMPRRESARRSHYLACESDIIETLHMRLTLLQMSFGKHIERKHICFFAGEILDEVYSILHYIKTTPKLDLPYKVTDELFDLSTMAMEYFKEKIEPNLPEIAYFSTDFLKFSSSNSNKYGLESSDLPADSSVDQNDTDVLDGEELIEIPQSNMVLRKRIRKIKQGMKKYNNQLTVLRQELKGCKKKTSEQQKQISDQQKQLADQQKQTLEYATRLDEYDKKNEEISRKFSTLLQELNKCKTELQYWRCKSSVTAPICNACGSPVVPQPEELQILMNQGVNPEGLGLEQSPQPTAATIENPDNGTNEPNNEELLNNLENNVELEFKGKDKNVEPPSATTNTLRGSKRKSVDTNEKEKPAKKKGRHSSKRGKRAANV